MKRFLLACSTALVLITGGWAVNAASTSFSGTWVLDKSKSQGLPRQWENVQSYTMVITQDDKQLTVDNKFEGGGSTRNQNRGGDGQGRDRREGAAGGERAGGRRDGTSAGGGQGRGRGGRGFGMGMATASYKLDGTEVTVESAGGRGGPAKLKAQWRDGGKVLELTSTRSFNFQGNEMSRTTKQRLELAEGGKVLKVKLTVDGAQGSVESAQGPQESVLVFNKQQ